MTDEDKSIGTREGVADAAERFQTDTLAGDIRDFLLERLRWEQDLRPWSDRSEEEQQTTIDEAFAAGKLIVGRAIRMIAAETRDPIVARLKDVKTDGDKITASAIVAKTDPHRHALFDAAGSSVMMMVVDPEEYEGEREPVAINADQKEFFDPETGEILEPQPRAEEQTDEQRAESERITLEQSADQNFEKIYAFGNEEGTQPTLPKAQWKYGEPEEPWFTDEPTPEDEEREGPAVMCRRIVPEGIEVGTPVNSMWSQPFRRVKPAPEEQPPAEGG